MPAVFRNVKNGFFVFFPFRGQLWPAMRTAGRCADKEGERMKKQKLRWLSLLLAVCLLTGTLFPALAAEEGPSGSTRTIVDEPYVIESEEDLLAVMSDTSYWDKDLTLSASLDMSGKEGTAPIGNDTLPFSGSFDGQGNTITGLTLHSDSGYTGLFGNVTGTVRALTLSGAIISDTASYAKGTGAIAGYNQGTITECKVTQSTVSASYQNLGGLVGYNEGSITACSVQNSDVLIYAGTTMAYTGGFVGYHKAASSSKPAQIMQCYVSGGSVGKDASSTGSGNAIGGFAGRTDGSAATTISECYSATSVYSSGEQVGGFVGSGYYGVLSHCFARTSVTGGKKVGGFVGATDSAKYISCYTTGAVTSTGTNNYFGRFFGDGFLMSSYVTNAFYLSTSPISGDGSEKSQGSYLQGKTQTQLQGLSATLGAAVWTSDDSVNDGYPYLINLTPPAGGSNPSQPVQLTTPSSLSWDAGTLSWNEVAGADSYTVLLYRKQADGAPAETVGTYPDLTLTSINLASYITVSGSYYATVQAIGDGDAYLDSEVSAYSADYIYTARDEQGYILISSPQDLMALAQTDADLDANYRLTQDIDFSTGSPLTSKVIGNYASGDDNHPFTGIFDGNGYAITGLSLSGEALFSYIGAGGILRNLTLINARVEDGVSDSSHSPAVLVGRNAGTIENCFLRDCTVVSKFNACTGGLVGTNLGIITRCGVDGGSVSYQNSYGTKIGGFVGRNLGNISESFSSASVSGGSRWVGGFAGSHEGGVIADAYALGNVTAPNASEAGGFAGLLIQYDDTPTHIENVYASGNVSAQSGGPLAGGNLTTIKQGEGTIANCYYNTYKTYPPTQVLSFADGLSGLTSGEMKTAAFLARLDTASLWALDERGNTHSVLNNGYPYLNHAAPLPAAATSEPVTVELAVATYDRGSYAFEKTVPVTIDAIGDPVTLKTVMDAALAQDKLTYVEESSALTGSFVSAINGLSLSAPDGWMFTINDQKSAVGISSARVFPGDRILWYEGTPAGRFQAPSWAEVTGTDEISYIDIDSAEDLLALAHSANPREDWAKNYRLSADFSLADMAYTPIGSKDIPFSGIFEGNGHTISDLTITGSASSQNLGLFGYIEGASILNVTLENATVAGGSQLGLLVGYAGVNIAEEKASLIGGCTASGSLTALGTSYIRQTDAGGLIGVLDGGEDRNTGKSVYSAADNCTADVALTASTHSADPPDPGHVGGFVGWNKGNITACAALGNVFGGNTTGGFAGTNFGNIYHAHAQGNVTAGYTTGGFVGSSGIGTELKNCYATGNVVAIADQRGSYFGGFAGSLTGKAENCIATGTLTPGWSYNGAFAGYYEGTLYSFNENFITIKNCYGNRESSLGTELKGLGNYLNSQDDTNNQAAAAIALSAQDAKNKLAELLGAIAGEQAANAALDAEALKYEQTVLIPGYLSAQSDVTSYVAKLKPGEHANDAILVQYRDTGGLTHLSSSNPIGRYTLAQPNDSDQLTSEEVVLLLTVDGQTRIQPVTVQVQPAYEIGSVDEIISAIEQKYGQNPAYIDPLMDWFVMDFAHLQGADALFSSPQKRDQFIRASLANLNVRKITDYQRVAIMMSALDTDASDLIATIAAADMSDINEWTFALLAYDAGAYTLPAGAVNTREKLIADLLAAQNADGGWSYQSDVSQASMTAMVLSALAPYRTDAEIAAAIDRALTCLSDMQQENGGYLFDGKDNSNDCAMVIVALSALGIDADSDPRFIKAGGSVFAHLLTFVTAEQMFGYEDTMAENPLSTEQGLRALIAYRNRSDAGFAAYRFGTPSRQIDLSADSAPQEDTPGQAGTPNTGDGELPLIWITLSLAALLVLKTAVTRRHIEKNHHPYR